MLTVQSLLEELDLELATGADSADATGETGIDAVGLFELSPAAMPMRLAASDDPLRFGDRFRGLVDGGAAGLSGGPNYGGSQGRSAKTGTSLAACCDDPTTEQGDPLLTAPTFAASVSGAAPEVSSWALMILGLGFAGLMLRGQRGSLA